MTVDEVRPVAEAALAEVFDLAFAEPSPADALRLVPTRPGPPEPATTR